MLENLFQSTEGRFHTCAEIRPEIIKACKNNPDVAKYYFLGKSQQKRIIDAVVLGKGSRTVSLIAGAHSDEPVGPEMLRTFILNGIEKKNELVELFERFCFLIIPHINPDGEIRNQPWITQWPDVDAYLLHAFRELPGQDIEFGYPDLRPENRCVSMFLNQRPAIDLHISFHGMGFSEGAMLLIERHWIGRTQDLRKKFAAYANKLGLSLHDHDRKGEKGFLYIGPGFTTTPEGSAMQKYFIELGDHTTASLFHNSSMEFVRQEGNDALCLVTELPLFTMKNIELPAEKGIPASYLAFRDRKPKLIATLLRDESIDDFKEDFQISPLDLQAAIRFQLYVLELGLETIEQ
ncbi:MAG: M14 family zinc carboxypeptidase [bacterium]